VPLCDWQRLSGEDACREESARRCRRIERRRINFVWGALRCTLSWNWKQARRVARGAPRWKVRASGAPTSCAAAAASRQDTSELQVTPPTSIVTRSRAGLRRGPGRAIPLEPFN